LRALISGQAGVAVILDADRVVSIDVENERPVARDPGEWPYLLEGADDAYELNDVSEKQVVTELDLAWRRDRSLHLALIFLGGDTEKATRKASAAFLEELLADDKVLKHTVDRLYVAPMPGRADLEGALKIARNRYPSVAVMLQRISEAQDAIARSRQAWDLLPPDLFGGLRAKESFGFKAVEQGLFSAISSNRETDLTGLSPEDLEVIKRWRRGIRSIEDSLEARRLSVQSDRNITAAVSYRKIAIGGAACVMVGVALTALFLDTRPVEASSLVRLGTSQPGTQVVQASLVGLQQELYGQTLIPYPLRNQSKKRAEHFFALGDAQAKAGKLQDAAMAYKESNTSYGTLAAQVNEAATLLNSSQLSQAERLLDSTLSQAERQGSELLKAAILTNLGHIYRVRGQFGDADQAYTRALAIDRSSKYKAGEVSNLNNLALILFIRGEPVKSLQSFRQALSIAEETGVESVAENSRLNIALILSSFGRSLEAEKDFKTVAAYYQGQTSPLDQAYYYFCYGQHIFNIVIAATYSGNVAPSEIDQALSFFSRALDLYNFVSNKSGQAFTLMSIGQALRAKGRFRDALDRTNEALILAEEVGDVYAQAVVLRAIAAWYHHMKAYDLAILNYERSLDIARRIGAYGEECTALEGLSTITAVTGQRDVALKYNNEAVAASLKSGDTFSQALAYDDLGFVLYKSFHRNAEALQALERAYDLYSEVDSPFRDQTRSLIDEVKRGTPPGELDRGRVIEPRLP
jgi:tetratricopeptide (TPR) repeat protein